MFDESICHFGDVRSVANSVDTDQTSGYALYAYDPLRVPGKNGFKQAFFPKQSQGFDLGQKNISFY